MINITIDDNLYEVPEKTTILKAAKLNGIKIPTLCYNEKVRLYGGCRLCLVEVATAKAPDTFRLLPACCTNIEDGLVIKNSSERVKESRRYIIKLLLARSPDSEKLLKYASDLDIPVKERDSLDIVGEYLLYRAKKHTDTKCILCGLCVRVCAEITERNAINFSERGMKRKVKTPFDKISKTCIGCGACAYVCPTTAITVEEA